MIGDDELCTAVQSYDSWSGDHAVVHAAVCAPARPPVARFNSRRTLARRAIVRELDEFLGIFKYPDPSLIYAVAPSREAVLDD